MISDLNADPNVLGNKYGVKILDLAFSMESQQNKTELCDLLVDLGAKSAEVILKYAIN